MTAPLLRLESVSKSFWRGPRENRVLRDVSVTVHSREFVGVYGTRSVGKTTLLRVAAGFETPDGGTVALDGVDLASMSRGRRARLHRQEIAWIERGGPQSRDLPMRDYVALSLYRTVGPVEAQRRAVAELLRMGAADAADQQWADLSDTVRMLVALAQALVRKPKLLLADDPTAGLNVIDRERIVGSLREAAETDGCGVLMVVPDFPSLNVAHTVRALTRGRLLAPSDRSPDGGKVVEFPGGERSA